MARMGLGVVVRREDGRVRSLLAPMVALLLTVMTGVALASHTVTFEISPNPVVAGNDVTVEVTTTGHGGMNPFQLHICSLTTNVGTDEDPNWQPSGGGTAAADCLTNDPALAMWQELVNRGQRTTEHCATDPDSCVIAILFDTTPYIGFPDPYSVGFRGQHPPGGGHEGTQVHVGDLVINQPAAGSGDRHTGCNGLENAYSRVTGNNEAGKGQGKGAQVLQALAEDKGCDLGG
jgi:hypothetical protein